MRASYREGVAFVAYEDEPSDFDAESVAQYISTALLAHLFGKEPIEVAKAIVRRRKRRLKEEGW